MTLKVNAKLDPKFMPLSVVVRDMKNPEELDSLLRLHLFQK